MSPEELNEHIDARIDLKMQAIADLAAKKALESVYADIGKGVVKKILWVVGVGTLVLLSWLTGAGYIKP